MSEAKTKLGRRPCLSCGHPTWVKSNAAGTLTMACDECDLSLFAKRGTAAHAKLSEGLKSAPEPAPADPAPKPAKPRGFDPFGLTGAAS